MSRLSKCFRMLPALLCWAAGVMLGGILLLQIVGQDALSGAYRNLSLLGNGPLWLMAVIAAAALLWLRTREHSEHESQWWRLATLFLGVLIIQFAVARTCWMHLGWDPGATHTAAEEIARGLPLSDPDYFRLCPNNAPLALLLAVPLWVAVQIGLAVPYVVLPYIDAVLLNLAAWVCMLCVYRLTASRTARLFALTLSICWIALSPYILYPYTDTFSILFPILALYVYLSCKKPVLKWFLISLLCFFGASIKPTVLIFLIALVLISLCRFLGAHDFRAAAWKRAAVLGAALIIGAVPGRLWQDAATTYVTGSAKPEQQLSLTHYLMLGMNGDTYGGHSAGDVTFSQSYETLAERQSANLHRAWDRVKERGIKGNIKFLAVKAYKAYADGSFASHSSFLELEVPKREDGLSTFLRSFYHKRGFLLPYIQTAMQGIWLCVLTLGALAAFRQHQNPVVSLLCLTLIGLTAYLLLFEVWPRYLFLYAPFFVVLASLALDKPFNRIRKG